VAKEAAVRAFMLREREQLAAGLDFINARLAARSEAGVPLQSEEEALLEDLDYLYFYFPDKAPLQDLSPSFFARLQHEAVQFLEVIK
jgi:hypothetical protein